MVKPFSSTVRINSPIQDVYQQLINLQSWKKWAPWFIGNEKAVVKIAKAKNHLIWTNSPISNGSIRILKTELNKKVELELQLDSPIKVRSTITLHIEAEPYSSNISFHTKTNIPFLFFFLSNKIQAFVQLEFQRSLLLFKDYIEDGNIHSQIKVLPKANIKEFHYVGIKSSSTSQEAVAQIKQNFSHLRAFFYRHHMGTDSINFTQYLNWDLTNNRFEYITGIGISKEINDIPDGFIKGTIELGDTFRIRHIGPYHHVFNAWMYARNLRLKKEFKWNKKRPPIEIYENDSTDTPPLELITTIHYPLK